MKTLTNKGYTGAGIGILTPIRGGNLAADNHARNTMITALRAPAERANGPQRTWKMLERVTVEPSRITAIIAAALVDHRRRARPASPTKARLVRTAHSMFRR